MFHENLILVLRNLLFRLFSTMSDNNQGGILIIDRLLRRQCYSEKPLTAWDKTLKSTRHQHSKEEEINCCNSDKQCTGHFVED